MIPLTIFLLACAVVYLGTIDAAFSALMRLSLRLLAERSDRPGTLGEYLDDPVLLFDDDRKKVWDDARARIGEPL